MDMYKFLHHKTVFAGIILLFFLSWGMNLTAQTGPVRFSIPGTSVTEKDTFLVAVRADTILSGKGVFAYRFYISYSTTYLEFIGMEATGPVLSGWGTPVVNSANAGTIVMAGAGTTALSGNGVMLYLKFRSVRSGTSNISFNTTESYLNEGNPASVYSNGSISSAGLSYPDVYPDQQQMFIGDEVQMNVSGGQSPYVFTVDKPEVLQVTDATKVRAVGPGNAKVTVIDANGESSVTTGVFDVRAIRMDIQEVAVWPNDTFYIPVKLEIAPGTQVFSGRFDLVFNSSLSGLEGSIIQGDYPVFIENNPGSGRMTVSFAASSPITGNGVLCYLPFRAGGSGSQFVRFENMRFNEILLAWTTKSNYYITINSLPTLSMSPSSGTLMWGGQLKINISNGTAPYTWSVSDTKVASIDIQGNLTAITGGKVSVTATDANGASVTSGIFTVRDNQVSIYSTDGILDSDTRVPIITSSLPAGKAIFGFLAGVSFNSTYLDFVRAEAVNGNGLVQASLSGSSVQVAGALGQGVSSGVIGYLVFRIKNTLPIGNSANITFNSFSANENSLISVLENGTVRRVEQTSYRPVAIAGLDISLQEGSTGHLDGTASFDLDNDPLTYQWTAPDGFLILDPASPNPEFIAPYVDKNTVYTITLIVNDGSADSDPATMKVTVLQVNHRPEANAGADANYVEGSSVSLDGSLSFDSDGDALSYSWTSLDGIVLFNATSVNPSFILPQVTVSTPYRFTLIVNDGALNSARDTVSITAIQVNKKPVAYAGGDFSMNEKEARSLNGSLSYDADNDPLSYKWSAPPGISLSSETIANPFFTAPAVLRDTVLKFSLVVNDGSRNSDPDIVLVTVINLDSLSRETLIESISMNLLDSAMIDTADAIVTLYLPYGLDTRSLAPAFTLSRGASIIPASGSVHNFTLPVIYNVTAEDGVTSRIWSVKVYRPEKTMQRPLNAGWNWISLNIQPPQSDVSLLFNGLTLSDLDYIKSTEYSAVYYNSTGWFGNLTVFPQNRVVKFKKSIVEDLVVQGLEINPTITPIPLVKGWNDFPYLLKADQEINLAVLSESLPAGALLLKGLEGSSIYYTGSGWIGDLDTLKVLNGYRINVQNPGNVLYSVAGGARKSLSPSMNNQHQLLEAYGLDPAGFEYSATLIAEALSADGMEFVGPGDLMFAYNGGEVRGVAMAEYVAPLDRYIFILSYYSNEEDQEITFRVKPGPGNIQYSSNLSLKFKSDGITGEAYLPIQLIINDLKLNTEDYRPEKISIYPNPVADYLTVSSPGTLKELRLYDMTGKLIMEIRGTGNTEVLQLQQLNSGIYTLLVETDSDVAVRKIIKTSR